MWTYPTCLVSFVFLLIISLSFLVGGLAYSFFMFISLLSGKLLESTEVLLLWLFY